MQQLSRLIVSVCVSLGAIAAEQHLAASAGPADHPNPAVATLAEHGEWRLHETSHFVIAYDWDAARATHQGELLEATHRRFFESLGQPAFGIAPLDDKLVCLVFEDKTQYLDYAQRVDRVDMSWTVAYYSARTNRTAFYRYGDPRDQAVERTARATNNESFASAASQPPDSLQARRISLSSATHEAAHQLAFNTGLQKRGVMYPLWVSEGLATNFELHEAGDAFGPAHDNPTRRARLTSLHQAGRLQPLHTFTTVTRPPTDDARATDAYYAEAWGLFRFLYLHHQDALADYLAGLRRLPRGSRDANTMRGEFTRAFGPIEAIQTAYHTWIAGL